MSRRGRLPCGAGELLAAGAICALALWAFLGALAAAPAEARTVHFDGQRVEAARSWPVYRLSEHPRMCVRLDRRAVYLGTPAADSAARPKRDRAAAGDLGRRARASRAGVSALPTRATAAATTSAGAASSPGSASTPAPRPPRGRCRPGRDLALPGDRGLHRRPQPRLLAAEPDRELGQRPDRRRLAPDPDLRRPAGADQRLQQLRQDQPQPGDRAGRRRGKRRGRQAERPRDGPGSPIYNDMEAYTQTSSATAATLAFLEAWTEKLHSLGYQSGVYSSSGSGIEDLADQIGTGYVLPDHLWFANWNGRRSTADPYVPASAWASHQRIHQYRGGHDETLRRGHDQHRQQLRRRGDGREQRRRSRQRRPARLPRPRPARPRRGSCG